MPDQVDTTKIIDLGNLKYYHSRLSVNYLEPLNERVTSFATSSEIDEYLFNITSVSVDEPISNDYVITGMGLAAFINEENLNVNVAPGTCTIGGTTYNTSFTTLGISQYGLDDLLPATESSSSSSSSSPSSSSSSNEPEPEAIYVYGSGAVMMQNQPSAPGTVFLAIATENTIPEGTDIATITGVWETNGVRSNKTVTVTAPYDISGYAESIELDSSEKLVSVDDNGITLLVDVGSQGMFAVGLYPEQSQEPEPEPEPEQQEEEQHPAGYPQNGQFTLTVVATAENNNVTMSLEEWDLSSSDIQSNQAIVGKVTCTYSKRENNYPYLRSTSESPTPSGTNTILSAPTISLAYDDFEVYLIDGVISIQGKCYRTANDVANGYTFEDMDGVAYWCSRDYVTLRPVLAEGSESSELESLIPREALHDSDSECYIENYAGSLEVATINEEADYSNVLIGRTRAFPVKLTVRVSAEGITSSIPGGTNLVGITAYWMSNGSFVREKRWVSSTNALQSGSEVSIEVDTPVAMIERIELNEESLGSYINLSDTSKISAYIDYVAVPQYIVACVRNNRLAFKYMTYTSDSPTLATDEIIVGKVVYSYNSSSEEAEATIIPASEL